MLALLLAAAAALSVPFVPQEKDTCGAAALAMVLRYWQQPVSQDEIAAELLERELSGIRGSRLAELAQRRGFRAIAYEGDMEHLKGLVSQGWPIIVGWKMKRGLYHDVVVVGIDDRRREVLVHDPADGPDRRVAMAAFEKLWAGAHHWALLVTPEAP
jgi:ABC-type bacteriocin/lantibiotic exporter with double-glycine peptidase domain